MASKNSLSLAAMERIFRLAGAERVSDDAKVALRDAVVDHAEVLASKAVKFASHAGRRTVKASDIKLALR